MKRFVVLLFLSLLIAAGYTQPSSISVAADKTISLVFPAPVSHVDRGTKDVLVQTVKEANNILLVKAAQPGFAETNLTVITSDGGLYHFLVNYCKEPESWSYHLPLLSKVNIATYCKGLLDNEPFLRVKDKLWDISLR